MKVFSNQEKEFCNLLDNHYIERFLETTFIDFWKKLYKLLITTSFITYRILLSSGSEYFELKCSELAKKS